MDTFEDNNVQEELEDVLSRFGNVFHQISAYNDAVDHGVDDDSAREKIKSDLIEIQMDLLKLYKETLPESDKMCA